jgi:hypothetical protein
VFAFAVLLRAVRNEKRVQLVGEGDATSAGLRLNVCLDQAATVP